MTKTHSTRLPLRRRAHRSAPSPRRFERGPLPNWLSLSFLLLALVLLSACSQAEGDGAAAGAAVGTATEAAGEAAAAGASERIVTVEVREMVPTAVTDRASLSAELLPLRRAVLAAEVPGTVDRLRVREGQSVAAGASLLEIDTRALAQRLAEAEAVHRQRQIQFERAEKLLERRSITQVQMLDAVTARDVAVAQLERARLELEKSRVRAPWAGTVAVRHVETGDYVQLGAPVLELVDVRRLEVRAPAPASDVPFLRVGSTAQVRVDVFPGEVFPGRIVRLGTELDPGARTLDVVAEIDNSDGRLRPGLSARLEVARRELTDALLLPLDAVVELGDRNVVYVVAGGRDGGTGNRPGGEGATVLRAEQRTVELGPVLGTDGVLITSGLAAGDRVLVGGQRRVSPGQRIRLAETP